jgi:hypothetical protein
VQNISNAILTKQPEVVYLSGGEGRKILEALIKSGKAQTSYQDVTWTSGKGEPITRRVVLAQLPGTRVVYGDHFTSQVGSKKEYVEVRNAFLRGESKGQPVKITMPEPAKAKTSVDTKPSKVKTEKEYTAEKPSVIRSEQPKKKNLAPSKIEEAPKKVIPMTEWSTARLKKAWEAAGRSNDPGRMYALEKILGGRGVRV